MGLLKEEITRIKQIMGINEGEFQFGSNDKKIIDDFIDFVKKELKIDNDIEIKLQNDKEGIKTTAVYKYQEDGDEDFENSEVRVYSQGRAIQDILRSIAHELAHHMQHEKGELKGKQSSAGSPIENEANAVAGEMLRKFGEKHPEIYNGKEEMDEQEEGGEASSSPSGGGEGYPSVPKWESGLTRGKANTLTINVWSSDVSRGKANPIDQNSKWESGLTRGKANSLF